MLCINCRDQYEVTINDAFDVPYSAGYSRDGTTIYIDRSIPSSFVDSKKQKVDVHKYLIIHEITEKALKDELKLDYNTAHTIAMGAEMQACSADGVNYDEYYGFLGSYIVRDIKPENFEDVPPDLDISPYIADGLTDVVEKLRKLQSKSGKK